MYVRVWMAVGRLIEMDKSGVGGLCWYGCLVCEIERGSFARFCGYPHFGDVENGRGVPTPRIIEIVTRDRERRLRFTSALMAITHFLHEYPHFYHVDMHTSKKVSK